jgi:MATE family multidrug resistance protein
MDAPVSAPPQAIARPPPALKRDPQGRRRVDLRAVVALALPLFLNSSVQAVLNLTDTWFLGRISTAAVAAVGAVYWFVIVFVLVFGGVAMAVQTLVAQAYGAGEYQRASRATWTGLWVALSMTPLYVVASLSGDWLLRPFALEPQIRALALEFWFPRMLGAVLGVSLWAVSSFFSGIGRTGVTLAIMIAVALVNAALNQLFIFELGWGVAGAAWATGAAQLVGLCLALAVFLTRALRVQYGCQRTWRTSAREMRGAFLLGLPMGLVPALDVGSLALFQVMQVGLGEVAGAATLIVMMMTSIAYMPAVGIASAGTTLVGQSIGAGDKAWATRVGNTAIKLNVAYMGLVSLALALGASWFLPLFVSAGDAHAAQTVALGATLLWFAAAYQIFDGLNLGCAFALRGAGDARVPALLVLMLSWLVFIPLAHTLTFGPGQGWIEGVPKLGWGAVGGWTAIAVYTMCLGLIMLLRWRSGAWRRIDLGDARG